MASQYRAIDSVIGTWVKKHEFTLFTSVQGFPEQDFRAVYLSSAGGECFQIWIDPPESDRVAIHAQDIETENGEVFRHDWSTPIANLPDALDGAVAHVRGWMKQK